MRPTYSKIAYLKILRHSEYAYYGVVRFAFLWGVPNNTGVSYRPDDAKVRGDAKLSDTAMGKPTMVLGGIPEDCEKR